MREELEGTLLREYSASNGFASVAHKGDDSILLVMNNDADFFLDRLLCLDRRSWP